MWSGWVGWGRTVSYGPIAVMRCTVNQAANFNLNLRPLGFANPARARRLDGKLPEHQWAFRSLTTLWPKVNRFSRANGNQQAKDTDNLSVNLGPILSIFLFDAIVRE